MISITVESRFLEPSVSNQKSFLEQYNFTPAFSNQFSFPLEVRKIGIPLYVVSLILINSILENKLYSQQFLFFVFQNMFLFSCAYAYGFTCVMLIAQVGTRL